MTDEELKLWGYQPVRLLLDSHILLRLDHEPDLVPAAHRRVLADRRNEVFVSAVTAWELNIKRATGKLSLLESLPSQVKRLGFTELPIPLRHGEMAGDLPLHHKDPFDRMLVAQALAEDLMLVTADCKLAQYGVAIL